MSRVKPAWSEAISCARWTDLDRFAETARAHGCIENQQPGVLDVPFGEEANRSRTNHLAQNLALIRRAAMNLPGQEADRQSLRQRKAPGSLQRRLP